MSAAVMEHSQISQPPTRSQEVINIAFRWLCNGFAWLFILLIAFIVLRIATSAVPALRHQGLGFLAGTTWDPNQEQYGILPEIWGTLYSSLLALVMGAVFGLAAAIFLSEGYLAAFVFGILKFFGVHFHPVWG
jgi:phosphate transport system permease protein